MFNEVLKIKPVLDQASTRQMESTLSERFSRVAQRFGSGLKSVIKGSVLGISLGLLNKLLNPLEALEDKIKGLLGQGTDLTDMADKFNTTPGKLKRLQDVSQSLGVSPDQLKEMLTKFSGAVEKARTELEDPTSQISASTNVVRNFVGEKDTAEAFFQLLQSLKAQGQGQGRDVFFGEQQQRLAAERAKSGEQLSPEERQRLLNDKLLKHQSGLEARQANEKEIFGEALSGGSKRLVEGNLAAQFAKIKEPGEGTLNSAIGKTAALADQQRVLQVQNQNQDFLQGASKLNEKMIQDMAKAEALKNERENKQLESFDDLKKASIAIDEVKGLFENLTVQINKGIGMLADVTSFATKFKDSRLLRGIFGGGDK